MYANLCGGVWAGEDRAGGGVDDDTEGVDKFGGGGEKDDTERADRFGRRVWGIRTEGRLGIEGSVILPLWFLLLAGEGRMEI